MLLPGRDAIQHTYITEYTIRYINLLSRCWRRLKSRILSSTTSVYREPSSFLRVCPSPQHEVTPVSNTSTTTPRLFVTKSLRLSVFQSLHNHSGIRASRKPVIDRFVWPHVNRDVRNWVRSWIPCQRVTVHCHTRALCGVFPLPSSRFNHVHIDPVGLLPSARGYSYLLSCVDRFTRWPEALPALDNTTETVTPLFCFWMGQSFRCTHYHHNRSWASNLLSNLLFSTSQQPSWEPHGLEPHLNTQQQTASWSVFAVR